MCIRDRLSTEHREIGNFKNNRRSLIELFKGTHNQTGSKTLRKSIDKMCIRDRINMKQNF